MFQDGDTIPHPEFVADHLRLARPGTFVQGHRALIEQAGASFFGFGEFAADRRRALLSRQFERTQTRLSLALARPSLSLRPARHTRLQPGGLARRPH